MKILYLTKYTKIGASSRLRSYQYADYLMEEGHTVEYSPLFSDIYLNTLYESKTSNNGTKRSGVFLLYFKRFLKLFSIFKYDVIIVEKELFPFLPSFFEGILKIVNVKYIVDYDDAIFHNYDQSPNKFIRAILSNKIDKVMKRSYCVFAGNSYLAERAIAAGAKRVRILPTVIDLKKYKTSMNIRANFTVGWIGSPTTARYVDSLFPVFQKLNNDYGVEVNLIGARMRAEKDHFINYIKWSEDSEVDEINKIDVGIMPLLDSPWEKGKCSYKLIQYMACSRPVVASPVGMNKEVVIEGFNGQLAITEDDWYQKIEKYILDDKLRIQHGLNGKQMIDDKYNIQSNMKIISEVLNGLQAT